jgi:hypothetical protein
MYLVKCSTGCINDVGRACYCMIYGHWILATFDVENLSAKIEEEVVSATQNT